MKQEKPYEDISLLDFQNKFSTEQICWDYLVKMRWPDGVKCCHCVDSKLDFIQTRKVFECRRCHKQVYATAGTIFHKSRVPLRKWFWAIYLMATSKKGVSMLYLQNQLELGSYHTAWSMGHKIRQAMIQRKSLYTLGGTVETDEIFITEKAEPEATRRLFKTNESSVQSMTVLQNQNPRGLLTFRDELTALLVKWDREDGADERAYFLEGWNGNGSYTDFKIGRGLTEAPNICISLLGGIQPDKLRRYLYQAQNGSNDGLMQRLQLAVWPDEPEHWRLIDTVPNKAEKRRAFDIMKALAELDFIQSGAVQSEYDDRPYFRFDDAGQAVFNAWFTELQTVKIQQESNPLRLNTSGNSVH